MTAQVLRVFTHEHNAEDVARQEYQLAKAHFRQVVLNRACRMSGYDEQFRAASDRRAAAFERLLRILRS